MARIVARKPRPGNPETPANGNGREIDVPDVIWTLGSDVLRTCLWFLTHRRSCRWLLDDPSDCCAAKMQAGPRQHLGDLHLAHTGTERFQLLNAVADEVGELVDGFRQLDERIGTGFIQTTHPRGDRGRCEMEGNGRFPL